MLYGWETQLLRIGDAVLLIFEHQSVFNIARIWWVYFLSNLVIWARISYPMNPWSEEAPDYLYTVCRSPDGNGPLVFDLLSSNIETSTLKGPRCKTVIFGGFSFHKNGIFAHMRHFDHGTCSWDFDMISNSCQLVDFPPVSSIFATSHAIDPFLTPCPSSFSNVTSLSPLGSRDHCLISFLIIFLITFSHDDRDFLWTR